MFTCHKKGDIFHIRFITYKYISSTYLLCGKCAASLCVTDIVIKKMIDAT